MKDTTSSKHEKMNSEHVLTDQVWFHYWMKNFGPLAVIQVVNLTMFTSNFKSP